MGSGQISVDPYALVAGRRYYVVDREGKELSKTVKFKYYDEVWVNHPAQPYQKAAWVLDVDSKNKTHLPLERNLWYPLDEEDLIEEIE